MNHLENTKTALRYWLTVPVANVAYNLDTWNISGTDAEYKHTCGTVACFGGWLSAMPEFEAMGVKAGKYGEPKFPGAYSTSRVADILFGDDALFDARHKYEGGCEKRANTSDHEVVTIRLRNHIRILERA